MLRLLTVLAAVAALVAVAAAPGTARMAHMASYKTCRMSATQAQHMGAGYIVDGQYKVQKVSCARGKDVIRAFHKCRAAHGGKVRGRCPRSTSVLGFHCREGRRTSNGTEFTAAVTCVDGSRRVFHYYTNFT